MRFRFNLETVLQLRIQEQRQAQRFLSEAIEATDIIENRIKQNEQERQTIRSAMNPVIGSVQIQNLLAGGRYELQIQVRIMELKKQQEQLQQEVERRRELLKDVDIRLKQIEKLRENALQRHREEQQQMEQRELDELAVVRHFRRGF